MDDRRYQLLWVRFDGADLYAGVPSLGVHFSHHESGVTHFQGETGKGPVQSPVALITEVGTIQGKNIVRRTLIGITEAEKVFSTVYSGICSPASDYSEYRGPRKGEQVFELDRREIGMDVDRISLSVWAVPSHGSFRFNYHPDPGRRKVLQFTGSEPQVWIEVCVKMAAR